MIKKLFLLLILISGLLYPTLIADVNAKSGLIDAPIPKTVVLSAPSGIYFPLAQEIAQSESLPLFHEWKEALAGDPIFVLWVVAPSELSDPEVVSAGMAIKQAKSFPSVGVITGSTLESARSFWKRTGQVKGEKIYIANAEFPTAGVDEARLVSVDPDAGDSSVPMDTDSLSAALLHADYLTFTGHGSAAYLRINPEMKYIASDIPDTLPPVVVGTASCQTFRLWSQDSIALSFIDKGAAAYAGFAYSPNEGYLIGEFKDLPFRYTWPDFPIGIAMALQTRGTLQGFANIPFYFLAGDPRVGLQTHPPYLLSHDDETDGIRTIYYKEVPAGLIPVRVPSGGKYRYVEIDGVGSAADGDIFYNARIQLMSLDGDKFILFTHSGGDFTLRLYTNPPWLYPFIRPIRDGLDNVLLFIPQSDGDKIMLVVGGLMFLIALFSSWKMQKVKESRFKTTWVSAVLLAFGITILHGLYTWMRLPLSTITSKPLYFLPLWLVAVFILVGCGSFFFFTANKWIGRIIAVLVAVFPALFPALFGIGYILVFNIYTASKGFAGAVYNYNLGLLSLLAAVVLFVLYGSAFAFIRHGLEKKW